MLPLTFILAITLIGCVCGRGDLALAFLAGALVHAVLADVRPDPGEQS